MLRFAQDAVTYLGATLLLWVACPITEHINAWGFGGDPGDWTWAWIWLAQGTAVMALLAYARGWER